MTIQRKTLGLYGLPAVAIGVLFTMVLVYGAKFCTDELGLAPSFVALALFFGRLWDALSDPLVGYLSDRTRSRWGRRRSWMLVLSVPLGLGFWMVWSPPAISDASLWMVVAFLVFYTLATGVTIPQLALGADLAENRHDRSRIFGAFQVGIHLGALLALAAVWRVLESADRLEAASDVGGIVALACVALIILGSAALRERPRRTKAEANLIGTYLRVLGDPQARRVFAVILLSSLVAGSDATVLLYYADYVLADEAAGPLLLAAGILGIAVGVSVWVGVSKRFGKRTALVASLSLAALARIPLLFLGSGEVNSAILLCGVSGLLGGGIGMLTQSVLADVIERGEHDLDSQMEGAYFAGAQLSRKVALGLAYLIVLLSLEVANYVPNAAQGDDAQLAIRLLMACFPLAANAVAVWVVWRTPELETA